VTLEAIKADPSLQEIALLRQSRLSVMPVDSTEAKTLRRLGGLA
jgi:predicted RNA-binding protein with PUA-like domain